MRSAYRWCNRICEGIWAASAALNHPGLPPAVHLRQSPQARHVLGAHTWGIAIGLQMVEKPSPARNNQVDVFVTPGYAWDGFGRTLVALAPYKVSPSLFQDIAYDAPVDDPNQSGYTAPGHPVQVWLRYSEQPNRPVADGFQVCDLGKQMSRVQETFVLEIDQPAEQRDL